MIRVWFCLIALITAGCCCGPSTFRALNIRISDSQDQFLCGSTGLRGDTFEARRGNRLIFLGSHVRSYRVRLIDRDGQAVQFTSSFSDSAVCEVGSCSTERLIVPLDVPPGDYVIEVDFPPGFPGAVDAAQSTMVYQLQVLD